MRKAILALVLLWSTPALAQKGGGDFGIGLQVGAPTGLNAKYYMDRVGFQFGLGVVEQGPWDDGLHVFADVLFHPVVLAQTGDFTMPLYLGAGLRVLEDDNDDFYWCRGGDCYYYDDYDDDTHVGLRIPVGILMAFHKVPIDAFFEVAPTIDFIYDQDGYCRDGWCDNDDDRVNLYGTLGARWYF